MKENTEKQTKVPVEDREVELGSDTKGFKANGVAVIGNQATSGLYAADH